MLRMILSPDVRRDRMAKNLIIVESPAKAKTINKILGPDFEVTSSMGHLRDLPASKLGVDVEHDFAPYYIVIQKRRKFAKQLQEDARGKDTIYLAPDPDREGEAISWHLERLLRDDEEAQAKKQAKAATKAKPPRRSRRRKRATRYHRSHHRLSGMGGPFVGSRFMRSRRRRSRWRLSIQERSI